MIKSLDIHYTEGTIPVFAHRFGSWRLSLQRHALPSAELTRLYDRAAPHWQMLLDRLGAPAAYEAILRGASIDQVLTATVKRPRVLDCGIGTGALSYALASVATVPIALDGIDISGSMLEHAGRNLRATGLDVTLRQGDMHALPYGDSQFDLVMTAHVLEHFADPSIALREMVRVVKPGGLVMTCLTRRSALGMLVQVKWRTHRVAKAQAEHWLHQSGLEDVHSISFDGGPFCSRLSLACGGRKSRPDST